MSYVWGTTLSVLQEHSMIQLSVITDVNEEGQFFSFGYRQEFFVYVRRINERILQQEHERAWQF